MMLIKGVGMILTVHQQRNNQCLVECMDRKYIQIT